MLALVTRHRWIQLYYRGAHRRPGLGLKYVALLAAIAATLAVGGVQAHADPFQPAPTCHKVARNISVCVTGRAPRLFEIECFTPHLRMRCEYRQES